MTLWTGPDGNQIDLSTQAGVQAGSAYLHWLVQQLQTFSSVQVPFQSADGGGFVPSNVYQNLVNYAAAYDANPGNFVSSGDPTAGRILILNSAVQMANMLQGSQPQSSQNTVGPPIRTVSVSGAPLPSVSAPSTSNAITYALYGIGAYLLYKLIK